MKPLILITNDDGVLSPGLKAAAEAVDSLGELLIVAPISQQTSMSRAYPKSDDVGVIDVFKLEINGREQIAYGVHGAPAQAVSHGVLELTNRKPDFCVSGINYGENIGLNIIASGTVGGAFEANTYDIPAIAVSQEVNLELHHADTYNKVEWDTAIHFTRFFSEYVLKNGLPDRVAVLNVNIPADATIDTPIRLTTQSRQNYFVFNKPERSDYSTSHRLKVRLEIDKDSLERSSDIQAIVYDRVVSVTPLLWDLTAPTKWEPDWSKT